MLTVNMSKTPSLSVPSYRGSTCTYSHNAEWNILGILSDSEERSVRIVEHQCHRLQSSSEHDKQLWNLQCPSHRQPLATSRFQSLNLYPVRHSNRRLFSWKYSLRIVHSRLSHRWIPHHGIVHRSPRRPIRHINDDPLEHIRSDSKPLLHSIRIPSINLRCGRVLGTGLPSSESKRQLRKHGTNHDHNLSVRHPSTTEPSHHQPILLRDRCTSDWRKLRNHRLSQTVQFHNWSLRRPVQAHRGEMQPPATLMIVSDSGAGSTTMALQLLYRDLSRGKFCGLLSYDAFPA